MQFLNNYKADATADLVYRVCPLVLSAIGIRPDLAQGSLVFTLSHDNQEKEVNYVLEQLPPAVERLRSFSPVWRKKMAAGAGA